MYLNELEILIETQKRKEEKTDVAVVTLSVKQI